MAKGLHRNSSLYLSTHFVKRQSVNAGGARQLKIRSLLQLTDKPTYSILGLSACNAAICAPGAVPWPSRSKASGQVLAMLEHGRDARGTNKFMATSMQPVIPDGLVGIEPDWLNPANRQPASIVVSVSTGGGKITKLDILTVDALHPD